MKVFCFEVSRTAFQRTQNEHSPGRDLKLTTLSVSSQDYHVQGAILDRRKVLAAQLHRHIVDVRTGQCEHGG